MLRVDKHKQLMYNILKDIFELDIANKISFKGAKLCYFIYGLDRFSTDLDFDIISDLEDKNSFLDSISQILNKYGTIKKQENKRFTYFFLFSYGEEDMNIKLEFNKRIWKSNIYETINFFGTDIIVQDKGTIFANKLVALTDRKKLANRDLWDIYFFLKEAFPINDSLILERTGKPSKDYFLSLESFLETLNSRDLLHGLGEVLDEKQKFFVKNKLLNDLKGLVKFRTISK